MTSKTNRTPDDAAREHCEGPGFSPGSRAVERHTTLRIEAGDSIGDTFQACES